MPSFIVKEGMVALDIGAWEGNCSTLMAKLIHDKGIEFIPKNDSQVKRLLLTREDSFPEYTQRAFEKHFTIESSVKIKDPKRTLYLMRRKRG
jgi:hypothetical protein